MSRGFPLCRFFGHVAASGLGGADEYLTEVWEQLKALENEYLRVDLMVEIIMSQVPRLFGMSGGLKQLDVGKTMESNRTWGLTYKPGWESCSVVGKVSR